MRKIMSIVLVVCFVALSPLCVSARQDYCEKIVLENGSYFLVEVTDVGIRAANTISGSKSYTYYESDGVAQWKATLYGSFSYTGSSALCTSSSVDVTIYKSAWSVKTKSASKSANTASANVSVQKKLVGITVPASISLSCNANGKLS